MTDSQLPRQSLPVVGTPDKVQQLKREFAQNPPAAKQLNQQNVIDRALDPSKSPQQKRIEEKVIERLERMLHP